jgi:hypothetical protein
MRVSLNALGAYLGLLFALVYGAYSIATFRAGVAVYVDFLPYATFLWIPLMAVVLGAAGWIWRRRSSLEELSFQKALKYAFLAYVLYELGYLLVNVVIYDILDKGFNHAMALTSLEKRVAQELQFGGKVDGMTGDQLTYEKAHPSGPLSVFQVLLGFSLALVKDFILSMLIALAIRRKSYLRIR